MKNGRRVKNPKRNSSSRSKSKVLDISIIILIIALALVIAVGTIRDKNTLAKNMEIYSSDSSNNSEDNKKQATTSNPYEKIKKGEEVNILVLGNGVGLSEGKTDESGNWTSSLSKWLEETYKSKANITNLSQDKATVKVGLEELEKNKDNFDLAYIIFGENDQKEIKPNEFKEDYEKNDKLLKSILGENFTTHVMRCPGGYMSWKNMDELDKYLEKNNIASIDWNALNADAEGPKKNAKQLAQYAIKTSEGKEMVVLLMHDTYGKEETVKALPTIIKYFKDNGYEFRTLV